MQVSLVLSPRCVVEPPLIPRGSLAGSGQDLGAPSLGVCPEPSCLPAAPAGTIGAASAGISIPQKIIMGRKVLVLIGASI